MDTIAVELLSFAIIAVILATAFTWLSRIVPSKLTTTDDIVTDEDDIADSSSDEASNSTESDVERGVLFAIEMILFQTALVLALPWMAAVGSNVFGTHSRETFAVLGGLMTFLIVGIVYARAK